MAGLGISRPVPGTRIGPDYGVFTGRVLYVVEEVTALAPGPGPGQGYGDFTKVVVSTGGLTLQDILERIGGAAVHTLFDLSVTAPTPRTWKLAVAGIDDVPGAYRPLLLDQPALATAAALGGRSTGGGVTLTIANGEGTGEGPGRRFFDVFSQHVDGYAEPYDLHTMTLQVRLYSPLLPNQPFILGQALALQPASVDVSYGVVRLTFGQDERRYLSLPRNAVTEERYPHAPQSTLTQPIVPWFGTGLGVPTLPVDEDGGLFLIGTSPLATPLGGVTACFTIRPDPGATDSTEPVAFPVRLTTPGEVVLSLPGELVRKYETFAKHAERFEIPKGAFVSAVRLWLKRVSAGSAPVGSIHISIRLDNDGHPGELLVDRWATGEVNAAIVTSATVAAFDIPFQANEVARAAFAIGGRAIWVLASYAKESGGADLHIEVNTTGSSTGVMALLTPQNEWVLTGKQQRIGPPRQDFTGGGTLTKNVATGVIKTKAPVNSRGGKVDYVGLLAEGGQTLIARRYGRHKISDRPGAVPSARLELRYVDKALPNGNVALYEVADFGTLQAADWGVAEIGAPLLTDAITGALEAGKRSIDVTAAYNAAKAAGRTHFAWKLQYELEDEAVGLGRWYRVGATGGLVPVLVLTVTAGRDLRVELVATPLVVDLDYADGLGDRAAVLLAGDGDVYPPLGEGVALGVTINGLVDDVIGTHTGTPSAPITRGPDIMHFGWRSADEGCGLTAEEVNTPAFVEARARLADWFPLKGGWINSRDVRDWMTSIARCCRSFTYQDQLGRETIHTEPPAGAGSGLPTTRIVRPWEHGALRLFPLPAAQDSMYPISRVDVYYGWDFQGLEAWQGHAVLDHHETTPPDAERMAQAVAAHTRYGRRKLGGELQTTPTPDTSYEWVPLDEPGMPTGVRIRDLLWDRAIRRTAPVQAGEVELPRFALAWPLMTEFDLESDDFPSALARRARSTTPWRGATGTTEDAYRARRARCTVRAQPRLLAESAGSFPVLVTIQIEAWDTP